MENLTFGLAFAGFLMLAGCALVQAWGQSSRVASGATALVILTHVLLVWIDRYEGSFAQATRNGYLGFALFHSALAGILAAPFVSLRVARLATLFAFFAVCLGANGAVFRYEVVAPFRGPVMATTAVSVVMILRALIASNRANKQPSDTDQP